MRYVTQMMAAFCKFFQAKCAPGGGGQKEDLLEKAKALGREIDAQTERIKNDPAMDNWFMTSLRASALRRL